MLVLSCVGVFCMLIHLTFKRFYPHCSFKVLFLEEKILHLRPDQERDQTNFVDQSVRAFTVVDCINFLLIPRVERKWRILHVCAEI